MSEDKGLPQEEKDRPVDLDIQIPKLVNHEDVRKMLEIQELSLTRFKEANERLAKCSAMADEKFHSVTKLYKKASKQLADSKKDLDYIHKKISDMKNDLRIQKPDLFIKQPRTSTDDQ